jgi:hypothetical protein
MRKTTLAAVAALALGALLLVDVPTARADVGISIGIPLPGIAVYAPPPPVYYGGPAYYPRPYGPRFYGPAYGSVYVGPRYYGGGWRGGWRGGWGGHRHWRGCRH